MGTLTSHATALQIPAAPLGSDSRYETERRLVWNQETRSNDVLEFVYEVSWIAERGIWRRFLLTRRKL